MMITIPLPVPVPIITQDGDNIKIDRTLTESAKQARELGKVLSFDDENFMPICCGCKEFGAYMSTFDAPKGFKWGGWFCSSCLEQGRLANSLGLIIDQITCDIEPVLAFDQKGMAHNVV